MIYLISLLVISFPWIVLSTLSIFLCLRTLASSISDLKILESGDPRFVIAQRAYRSAYYKFFCQFLFFLMGILYLLGIVFVLFHPELYQVITIPEYLRRVALPILFVGAEILMYRDLKDEINTRNEVLKKYLDRSDSNE